MAGGSAEKRKAEEADAAPEEGARRSKRRRWDSADDANADAGAAAEASKDAPATDEPAAEKPAPSVAEKLAKAKAAAAKAMELAEKLRAAKAPPGPAPAPGAKAPSAAVQRALELAGKIKGATAAASTVAKGPGALRLNDKGQEVDEQGNLVTANVVAVSTFAVNAKSAKLEAFANAEKAAADAIADDGAEAWQDPRMGKGGRRRDRRSTFQVRHPPPARSCRSRSPVFVHSQVTLCRESLRLSLQFFILPHRSARQLAAPASR